ncbi:MAG: hypothetical protein GF347_05265, partial [Candidatus Moranbacteria bacterium]|nr:hypothetical protein [Candidatus Moranbacteria bacterium]
KKHFLILALILLVAAFLRFYALNEYPPGLYPDEAVNATDALRALKEGDLKVYYSNNNGREGLFINLLAVFFSLFGASILVLRLVPALIGFFTVLSSYFLGKTLINRKFGLIFSAFFAVSYWHLNFSRIGFRAILMPLILNLTFIFLFKGIKNLNLNWECFQKLKSAFSKEKTFKNFLSQLKIYFNESKCFHFILAGLIYGMGFYTYIAYRISPVIILTFFFFVFISVFREKQKQEKLFFKNSITSFKQLFAPTVLFVLSALLSSSFILYFFISQPDSLASRQNDNSISVFDPNNNQGNLILTVGKTFLITLGQFYVKGDQNWRHNLPSQTVINPIEAVFFTFGLLISMFIFAVLVLNLFKLRFKNKYLGFIYKLEDKGRVLILLSTFIVWFFIMLSPAFLTVEGLPHALRSLGSINALYFFASLSVYYLLSIKYQSQKYKVVNYFNKVNKVFVTVVFIFSFFLTGFSYFVVWGKSLEAMHAFEKRLVNIGRYLKENDNTQLIRYVVVNLDSKKINTGYPVSLETIRFLNFDNQYKPVYLLPEDLYNKNKFDPKSTFEIILQKPDPELVQYLKGQYGLKEQRINYTNQYDGTDFIVLR